MTSESGPSTVYIVAEDGGGTWVLPEWAIYPGDVGMRAATCRSCGAVILWVQTKRSGANAPIDPDGTSHFATCPQAADWRAKKRIPTVESHEWEHNG